MELIVPLSEHAISKCPDASGERDRPVYINCMENQSLSYTAYVTVAGEVVSCPAITSQYSDREPPVRIWKHLDCPCTDHYGRL